MSDGEKKRIFINPNLFSIENASRKKKPKPEKALRIKSAAKPVSDRTRKNQFLKKIRENQEKQYNSLFEGEKIKVDMPKKTSDKTTDEFQSDFDKSLTFMTAVADAKPMPLHNNHNHTFKNTSMRHQMDDFGIDLVLVCLLFGVVIAASASHPLLMRAVIVLSETIALASIDQALADFTSPHAYI